MKNSAQGDTCTCIYMYIVYTYIHVHAVEEFLHIRPISEDVMLHDCTVLVVLRVLSVHV